MPAATPGANGSTTPMSPSSFLARWVVPKGVGPEALPLLMARALRAIGDGYIAVLLPAHLLAIGLSTLQVGIISTATMMGSAVATLVVGAWGIATKATGCCSVRPS